MNAETLLLSLIIVLRLAPGYSGQTIEDATNDKLFKSRLEEVDKTIQLAVLYFVENDENCQYDEDVKNVANIFADTLFIKVNTNVCSEAQEIVADDGQPFIENLPTFVLRQVGWNRDKFDEFIDVKDELTARINQAKENSGFEIQSILSDGDFTLRLDSADQTEQLNVLYIGQNSDKYDLILRRLAILYPTVLFFKVDASICEATRTRFGVKDQPTIFLRILKINKCALISPEEEKLKNKIEQYKDMPKSPLREVIICSEFKEILNDADKSDKLVILFTVKNDNCKEIEPFIETLALLYASSVTVLKIDSDICKQAEDYFSEAEASVRDLYPKMLYRKFGENKHRLFGYAWFEFFALSMKYKDLKQEDPSDKSIGETIIPPTPLKDIEIQSLERNIMENEDDAASCEIRDLNLPVLQNGSVTISDTPFESSIFGGIVVLMYTCAFDSLVTIIMVAYSDSTKYAAKIDSIDNDFFIFISGLVKNGISPTTYLKRVELIVNKTSNNEVNRYEDISTTYIKCINALHNMVESMFKAFPTKRSKRVCSSMCGSKTNTTILKPEITITYQSDTGIIDDLQTFLNKTFHSEITKCVNTDTKIDCVAKFINDISDMHLFIKASYWDDSVADFVREYEKTETMQQIQIALYDIPKCLTYNSTTYELRGVISYQLGGKMRHGVGHYYAYAFRGHKTWQLFDDLKNKSKLIDENTVVEVELLIYTI